jgi:outer membrane receptor protein involved in Fe transport
MKLLAMLLLASAFASNALAQSPGQVRGRVTDDGGGVLPGVLVEIKPLPDGSAKTTTTSGTGDYSIEGVGPGRYQVSFSLINFASVVHRDVTIAGSTAVVNAAMHFALNAEVTVAGKRTFVNLADAENPAENLVGIAQSASQGAITAQQLDVRPLMRVGEVLETVPGVITTQHSGEGKANQYFLRGFNLDHGTDLAQTIAGMPVNMPSHAHGQGYSDINFMISELVSGVQFSKGPYFADQGDFATAGASNINYATTLDRPIAHVDLGGEGYGRLMVAASPQIGTGHALVALEAMHNDGPWVLADNYRKVNGVVRYSRGDSVNGLAITAMGYHGDWNSSDQLAVRAITDGMVSRFGTIDPSDGGHSYRYSGSVDWQRGTTNTLTKVTAFGIGYDLHLFSNFTYYLDDPVHGDQFEQADHRFVSGGRAFQRRQSKWGGLSVQNTYGVQVRNDDITTLGLYHTEKRVRLETRSEDQVLETEAGVYAQNEIEWKPWLRTTLGLRGDIARFRVDASDPVNSGTSSDSLISPKAGVTIGPWRGTEFYVNAGTGFHSNDARGTTISRDADGNPAERVTPLVRAKGGEVGVRTVAVPHLQTTATLWMLDLNSELVFAGDQGVSEPSRPSRRYGVEWANYYSPRRWLVLDGDVSWSHSRFTEFDPVGEFIPEAVGTVVSAGVSVDNFRRVDGSIRWRYFGPRSLIEDNSVRSNATSLLNLFAGYRLTKNLRVNVDVFNLLNAADSDIDYFYASRLPGEPLDGVADIHTHPTIPRTARVSVHVGF